MFNYNWVKGPSPRVHTGKKKRSKRPGEYRHIEVTDVVDKSKKTRTITVECPLEYPGLSAPERRRMYDGLAMIADAYRAADARCERNHYRKA